MMTCFSHKISLPTSRKFFFKKNWGFFGEEVRLDRSWALRPIPMIGGGIQKVSERRESLKFMRPLLSGELREELKGPERSLDSSLKKLNQDEIVLWGAYALLSGFFELEIHSSKGAFFHSTFWSWSDSWNSFRSLADFIHSFRITKTYRAAIFPALCRNDVMVIAAINKVGTWNIRDRKFFVEYVTISGEIKKNYHPTCFLPQEDFPPKCKIKEKIWKSQEKLLCLQIQTRSKKGGGQIGKSRSLAGRRNICFPRESERSPVEKNICHWHTHIFSSSIYPVTCWRGAFAGEVEQLEKVSGLRERVCARN